MGFIEYLTFSALLLVSILRDLSRLKFRYYFSPNWIFLGNFNLWLKGEVKEKWVKANFTYIKSSIFNLKNFIISNEIKNMLSKRQIIKNINQELRNSQRTKEEKIEKIFSFCLDYLNQENTWENKINRAQLLLQLAEKEGKEARELRIKETAKLFCQQNR